MTSSLTLGAFLLVYAVLHFMTMFCLPIIWVNATVYTNEMFDPKWRFLSQILFGVPAGTYIFTLIIFMCRTWTWIHICIGVATASSLPLYFLMPESPRWLAQNGHKEEAIKVLLNIAKINGKILSSNDELKIRKILAEITSTSHDTEDTLTPLDMFKHGQMVKSLILNFAWVVTCVSFYAIGLNSSLLSGNVIMNFFLARTTNFGATAYIVLTVNFKCIGRRLSLSIAYFILGISCLVLAFLPKEQNQFLLAFYLIAQMVATASKYSRIIGLNYCHQYFFTGFSLVYLITSELYPTNLRAQAVGSASTISRIFCICAPFLGPLAQYWEPLPMMIVGIPILIAGFAVLRLPETYNKALPETLNNAQEMEKI